jgi:hypothetical protein
MEIPSFDDLEKWVINLIVKLKLKPGDFTFLPAYGGVLLFVRGEGITWLPYSEVKTALGEVDSSKLASDTATVGTLAVAAGAHAALLPVLLAQRLIKGSYRVIARPSPKQSMSFLFSLIDRVVIEERRLRETLLNTFETTPHTSEKPQSYSTYVIKIERHLFDKNEEGPALKFFKGLIAFISGSKEPIFAIPPQSDVDKFASILENHGVDVVWVRKNSSETSEPDDDSGSDSI